MHLKSIVQNVDGLRFTIMNKIPKITQYNPPMKTEVVSALGRTKHKCCDGKYPFRTWEYAAKVATKLFILNKIKEPLETYLCPFCRYYHNGHAPGTAMGKLIGKKLLLRAVYEIQTNRKIF